MNRALNAILIGAIVVGAIFFVNRWQTLAPLKQEHDRLSQRFGALHVVDPDKYLVTCVDTGEPTHFLWRCYIPGGIQLAEKVSASFFGSSSGSSMHSEPGEFLFRCRFDFDAEGLTVHMLERGGGGQGQDRNPALAAFLKEHWNELQIEVLASEGTVELATDQALPLLTIRIPEELQDEFNQRAGGNSGNLRNGQLYFQWIFGANQALAAYDSQQAESRDE